MLCQVFALPVGILIQFGLYKVSDSAYEIEKTLIYLLSFSLMVYSMRKINSWKKEELGPLGYNWSFKENGFFVVFTLIQVLLFSLTICYQVTYYKKQDSIYQLTASIKIINTLTTIYMMSFMVKMSQAVWSDLPAN